MQNSFNTSESIWHPYAPSVSDRKVLNVVRAKGSWLYTAENNKIFDAISSWWVNIHGHCHPEITKAIAQQAGTLEHVIFSGFNHPPAVELAESLKKILPGNMSKIFFSDNGSTAVEVALKMAMGACGARKKLLAFEEAYHGDTFGAMSVSGRGIFNERYAHLLFEPEFVPFPSAGSEDVFLNRMESIFKKGETGAFIFEPLILGAAGMKMYSRETLSEMLRLCRQYDIITICDEVFTGFGRTGTLFASNGLMPDIITVSKGITGGALALGATACNERIADAFKNQALYHGHSYTANPIACAAANASIRLFSTEHTMDKVAEIEKQHQQAMLRFKGKEGVLVRLCGTVLALEFNDKGGYHSDFSLKAYQWFVERGFLIRPLGNVIYLLPPYCSGKEELRAVYDVVDDFLNNPEK